MTEMDVVPAPGAPRTQTGAPTPRLAEAALTPRLRLREASQEEATSVSRMGGGNSLRKGRAVQRTSLRQGTGPKVRGRPWEELQGQIGKGLGGI